MVFLIRIDENNAEKIKIRDGSNILGRDLIGCDDERISKTHCELIVNNSEIKIISLDVNSCFVKTPAISDTVIISSGQNRILQNGDTFGLLPNSFWYKISTLGDSEQTDTRKAAINVQSSVYYDSSDDNKEELAPNSATKEVSSDPKCGTSEVTKKVSDDGEGLPSKRQRLNDTDDDVKLGDITTLKPNSWDSTIAQSSNSSVAVKAEPEDLKPDTVKVEHEDVKPDTVKVEREDVKPDTVKAEHKDVKPETVKVEPEESIPATTNQELATADSTTPTIPAPASAAPSNGPAVRERCMYADHCYRKNPEHKRMFSHPSDPDYQQGSNIVCPFGAQCRRRDPRHWRDQTHPPGVRRTTKIVHRNGNVFIIQANRVYFYDDHFTVVGSDEDTEEFDYDNHLDCSDPEF